MTSWHRIRGGDNRVKTREFIQTLIREAMEQLDPLDNTGLFQRLATSCLYLSKTYEQDYTTRQWYEDLRNEIRTFLQSRSVHRRSDPDSPYTLHKQEFKIVPLTPLSEPTYDSPLVQESPYRIEGSFTYHLMSFLPEPLFQAQMDDDASNWSDDADDDGSTSDTQ